MRHALGAVLLVSLTAVQAFAQQRPDIDAGSIYLGTAGCHVRTGSGSPESAVTGSVCDTYVNTSNGDIYTKQSGTNTTTGWTIVPRLAGTNTWSGVQTFSAQTLFANGSAAAPSAAFTTSTGFFYNPTTTDIYVGDAGIASIRMGPNLTLANSLSWSSASDLTSADLALFRGGAGILEQRNGVNAQTSNIYNTVVGGDYERGSLRWLGNFFRVGTEKGGTGAARSLVLVSQASIFFNTDTTDTTRWQIQANGHWVAATDNAYDIGASGATRPRNIYAGTNVTAGSNFVLGSNGWISGASTGVFTLFDAAGTSFNRLELGGTSNLFPAIKRSSAALAFRLADDSADAAITAADVTASGNVGTSTFASQTTGWRIDNAGRADVRYLYTDEMRAKLFTADLESVLAGSQRITKSFSTVSQTFTCPAAGSTATLWVKDAPTFGDAAVFVSGDSVVLHAMTRSAFGPFTIDDCVGVVTAYADGTGGNAGQQSWTFTRNTSTNGGSMATSTTVAVDQLVQDFGTTGNGYVESTAVDGAAGVNAPYTQIVTWATAPVAANLTPRARFGNLKGITSTAEYGLLAGTYNGTNGAFFRASDQNFDLHGITAKWWDSTTNVVTIAPNSGSPYVGIGSPAPSACCTTAGLFLGWDHAALKAKASFYSDANNFLTFDGTKLTWKAANTTLDASGNLTAASATLSGAITATSGSISGNFDIGSGGALRSVATAFGTGTGIYADYNAGTPRLRVGNPSGNRLSWDGTDLTLVSNTVTIGSGGISLATDALGTGFVASNAYAWTVSSGSLGVTGTESSTERKMRMQAVSNSSTRIPSVVISANNSSGIALTAASLTLSSGTTATATINGDTIDVGPGSLGVSIGGTATGSTTSFRTALSVRSASGTVPNAVTIGASDSDYGSIGYGVTYLSAGGYQYANSDYASAINFHAGGFRFDGASSGTAGGTITFTTLAQLLQGTGDFQVLGHYSFTGDTDTYMYNDVANRIAFVTGGSQRMFIDGANQVFPGTDNAVSLGVASFRWSVVFAVNGTIQTSDARMKRDITDTAYGTAFLLGLRPVDYSWRNPASGAGVYQGFLAQDVATIAPGFGGLHYDTSGIADGLNYTAFIAPLVKGFQELEARVRALEGRQ